MRKNDIEKLRLFTGGIVRRLEENALYAVGCTVTLRSGGKVFSGKLVPQDERWLMTLGGRRETVTAKEFGERFLAEAGKYDEVRLVYTERGTEIVVEADGRGVRSRSNPLAPGQEKEVPAPAPKAAQQAGEEEDGSLVFPGDMADMEWQDNDGEWQETGSGSRSNALRNRSLLRERDYIIKPDEAPQLLRAIGLMTADGKLKNDKIRKYNQIDLFLEQVRPLLESIEDDTVQVLDCGCGKSYLSFALNYMLRDVMHRKCFVTGVDRMENVIGRSRETAQSLGYRNMEFLCRDLRQYSPSKPSLVISLHACDIATDLAMGLGIRTGAKAIASVPCCHRELLDKTDYGVLAPIASGMIRARLNDAITDGLRILKLKSAGYEVRTVQYVSPIDSPKNLLITARLGDPESAAAKKAGEEYRALCRELKVTPAIERYSSAVVSV